MPPRLSPSKSLQESKERQRGYLDQSMRLRGKIQRLQGVRLMKIRDLLKKPQLFEVYAITVFYTVTVIIILLSGRYSGIY